MEDQKIVKLYFDRDEAAITESSNKYGRRLLGIANHILTDPETSKECENDTYLQAWNRIPPDDPSTYLFAYLARIIRHGALDACRRNQAAKRSAQVQELTDELLECTPAGGFEVEEEILAKELGKILSDFLRTLPVQHRRMFVRRYWYMDSVAELAQEFSCSESRVKSLLFRLRKKLRKYLEKEGYAL